MDILTRLPAVLQDGTAKNSLLTLLARRYIPDSVETQSKLPLIAPTASLFKVADSDLLRQTLSTEALQATGIFDPLVVEGLCWKRRGMRRLCGNCCWCSRRHCYVNFLEQDCIHSSHLRQIKQPAKPIHELLSAWCIGIKITLGNSQTHRRTWFFLPGKPGMEVCFNCMRRWESTLLQRNILYNLPCHCPKCKSQHYPGGQTIQGPLVTPG